jgi:integrase
MASVRLKKGSSVWFACYKMPTGKQDAKGRPVFNRVQRSSGTSDRTKAQQIAISYERAAIAASERQWTERSARQFLAELNALTGVSLADTEPAEPFLWRWLASRKAGMAVATFEKYEGTLKDFLAFLGHRARGPLGELTPAVISSFRDHESASGKSAATVNKALMVIGQALDGAVQAGVFATNPARGLNVKGAKGGAQKRRAFTFAQFQQLVTVTGDGWQPAARRLWKNQKLSADWQPFIMTLGYTGGRQQEVAKLKWSQVDVRGSRITFERTKTGDEHWIPLHPALLVRLKAMPAHKPDDYVFPQIAAIDRRRLSNKFRLSILPRIGIKQEYHDATGKGRKLADYSIHCLRHSLSTWLNAAGVSEMVRMRIVGHENKEVSRGYTHTELVQLAAELSKVPGVATVPEKAAPTS